MWIHRTGFGFAIVALLLAGPRLARGEHFTIDLKAAVGDDRSCAAISDQSPPETGVMPRPVLSVARGEVVTLQFIMTNVYPHGTIKGAGARFYVVRQEEIGQKSLPPLDAGVVTQGSFIINLKPKARIGSRLRIRLDEPGAYLLRVETQRTMSTHEHFSAIDIEVK
jgi:hypothetical protein